VLRRREAIWLVVQLGEPVAGAALEPALGRPADSTAPGGRSSA
jgi:hypothetical protein